MPEIYNEEGKLIATIHDPVGFSQLLDTVEELLQDYSLFQFPMRGLIPNLRLHVDQNTIDNATNAAQLLQALRRRFGDERDGLYPVGFPPPDDQGA
jgi:hypothetical protein